MAKVTFTTKGYIEVWWTTPVPAQLISRHRSEAEAIESITAHAESVGGDQTYDLRFPNKTVKAYGILAPGGDTAAPTVPQGLVGSVLSATSVLLSWSASTDDTGVTGYQVYRDGVPLATTANTFYSDSGLSPSTLYTYTVSAYDAASNVSNAATPVQVTTNANSAPSWSIGTQALTTNAAYGINLLDYCVDADGDAIVFSTVSGSFPPGISANYAAKTISGTPTTVGNYSALVRASDGITTADQLITFEVLNADTTAPSVPTNLAASGDGGELISVTWTASTDPTVADARTSGLAGYKLYRDGSLRATLGLVTTYNDSTVAAGTTYSYTLLAFDAAGNESAQTAAVEASVAQFGWTIPDTPYTVTGPWYSQTAGQSYDASALVNDPANVGVYSILTQSKNSVAGSYGFTVDADTGVISVPATLADPVAPSTTDSYSATIDLTEAVASGGSLADWTARSTGAGVVWANRFATPSDPGLFWGLSPTNFTGGKRTGYVGPDVPRTGVEGMVRTAEGVIPGTGCLEQYTPANVIIGGNRWGRPLAPTTGAMAVPAQNIGGGITTEAYTPSTTGPEMDVNNAGWPRLDYKSAVSSYVGDGWNKINGMGGGQVCNPSDLSTYQRTIPAVSGRHPAYQEITAAPADGFYLQYWVKFPVFPNGDCLLDYTQGVDTGLPYRGAWQGKSWLCHSFGQSNYFHEIGMMFKGYSPNAASGYKFDFAPLIYGHREDWQYTNGPQLNTTSGPVQGDYSMTCSYQQPATCWKPTRNKWISILVHVIPGSQNVDDEGDINAWLDETYGVLTRNQTVEMWVADEDRIRAGLGYLKLLTSTGYASFYSGRYSLNGQTKSIFGFGDQYYGTSNSGGDLLITPETNTEGFFTGCEIEFMQGAVGSLPSGIPNSSKVYCVMVGSTAFKVATSRANAQAGIVLPYVNGGTDVSPNRNRVGFSAAPGYSLLQLLQQMNLTASNSSYEKPSWILYDQVILSTQPIPCPEVV